VAAFAAFAVPLLLRRVLGRARGARVRTQRSAAERVPLLANVVAFLLFLSALFLFPAGAEGRAALLAAVAGCLLAFAGAVVIVRSRMELGSAWSLVPIADAARGVVTTGPYRIVRHPIYFGFFLLTAGEALAFASWPALLVLLVGIVPSFVWRACREERLLRHTFGERYDSYRKRTKTVIPYLF
jgi:protein-S-isoprenylcysteine O-methyltransferase Ste14